MEILMISLLILLFSIKLNSHLVIENLAIRQVTSHQRCTLPAGQVTFSDRSFRSGKKYNS